MQAGAVARPAPGPRWFLEYWYVVRDDIDPGNNLGLLEVLPRKQQDRTAA